MAVERVGVVRHLDIGFAVGTGLTPPIALHGVERHLRNGIGRVEDPGAVAELLVIHRLIRLKDHAHIGHTLPSPVIHPVGQPGLQPAPLFFPVIQIDPPDDPDGLAHILPEQQREHHPLGASHQPVPDDIVRLIHLLADRFEPPVQRALCLHRIAVVQQLSVIPRDLVAVQKAMLLLGKIRPDHPRIGIHHPNA